MDGTTASKQIEIKREEQRLPSTSQLRLEGMYNLEFGHSRDGLFLVTVPIVHILETSFS